MTRFEQDKAAKLKRLLTLRVFNMLGIVASREDRYNCAEQKFRIIRPLTWVFMVGFVLVGSVLEGVPEVIRTLRDSRDNFVWW